MASRMSHASRCCLLLQNSGDKLSVCDLAVACFCALLSVSVITGYDSEQSTWTTVNLTQSAIVTYV